MRRSWIERIRERIGLRQYDMTAHAAEEIAEDELDILDVEHAVVTGRVVKVVGVVGRFLGGGRCLIFTVYKVM